MPPALVATLPPIVLMDWLAGSGGYQRPWVATWRRRSSLRTPASTTAYRSAGSTSRILVIRSSERTRHPAVALAPPDSPVPAPRGTTGTPCAAAMRTAVDTSSTEVAKTTAAGSANSAHSASSWLQRSRVSGSVTTVPTGRAANRSATMAGVVMAPRCYVTSTSTTHAGTTSVAGPARTSSNGTAASLGSRLSSRVRAPKAAARATYPAAGYTAPDVPTDTNRSHDTTACSMRSRSYGSS